MKKIILTFALLGAFALTTQAQEIYNEVKRMQKNFYTIKMDKAKKLD